MTCNKKRKFSAKAEILILHFTKEKPQYFILQHIRDMDYLSIWQRKPNFFGNGDRNGF